MRNKFDFYEEVVVLPKKSEIKEIWRKNGYILGISAAMNNDKTYGYDVNIENEVWELNEQDLKSTGRKFKRDDFYDGTSVTVEVNEKGEGKIKGS